MLFSLPYLEAFMALSGVLERFSHWELRSRFQSLPGAFNACLIPVEKDEKRKKGLKATLSKKFDEVTSSRGKEAARFAQMWNKIIESFREEDLINNRERKLLLVPYGLTLIWTLSSGLRFS